MPKDKKSMFQKAKDYGSGVPYKVGSGGMTGLTILELGKHLLGLKDGGRVKGCGIAKRGFGKAMKRKK
jgi:hypothetical protein